MPQNNNRRQRIASLISRNISDIVLFELKKPIFKLVSINQVDVTPDYQYAKVYVSHLDKKKVNEAVDELNANKGLIRSFLAKKMDIYKVPDIVFIKDDTYEKGERIEEILKEIKKKDSK